MQAIVGLIPVLFAGIAGVIAYCFSITLKSVGMGALMDLRCLLERTPALDAFFMLLLWASFFTLSGTRFFRQISNHGILSLDILYFLSTMILIFCHTLKEFEHPLVKEI